MSFPNVFHFAFKRTDWEKAKVKLFNRALLLFLLQLFI